MPRSSSSAVALCIGLALPAVLSAEPRSLGIGNILVSSANTISERTKDGDLVQWWPVPYGADDERGGSGTARDLVLDGDCGIAVFNGSFEPLLSIHDLRDGSWTHASSAGWNIPNGGYYGGIAATTRFVYLPDLLLAGAPQPDPSGMVRFDRSSSTFERFDDEAGFFDVSLGLDGKLYGLTRSNSIAVYDPVTMDRLTGIPLSFQPYGIAVNAEGHIFATGDGGAVYHLDASGAVLAQVEALGRLGDIDISREGLLAIGDWDGWVTVADESLTVHRRFTAGNSNTFVAFVEGGAQGDCLLPPSGPILAQVEAPTSALVGQPASVGVRLLRDGFLVTVPVRFKLFAGGAVAASEAAVFAAEAVKGKVLAGGGSNHVTLESEDGLARIVLTGNAPGPIELQVDDPEAWGISFQPRVVENFEATDGGFTVEGTSSAWTLTHPSGAMPRAHSGEKAWALVMRGDSDRDSRLVTPKYELPPSASARCFVEFWEWYSPLATACSVDISVDGGAWKVLTPSPGYTGAPHGYGRERFDLRAFAGHEVRFQFRSYPESSPEEFEWTIDDFRIEGIESRMEVLLPDEDTDGDALPNGLESERGTDPLRRDSDDDGIDDIRETKTGIFIDLEDTGTDPVVPDTDGGGMDDYQEALRGRSPFEAADDLARQDGILPVEDGEGLRWDCDRGGRLVSGHNIAFLLGLALSLNGRPFPHPQKVLVSADNREIVLGPQLLEELHVTRDIRITADGTGFARYLEILENRSPGAVAVARLTLSGVVLPASRPAVVATASGDLAVSADDDWLVLEPGISGQEKPYVTFILAGERGEVRLSEATILEHGEFSFSYDVALLPGETVAIYHLVAQSVDRDAALSKAWLGLAGGVPREIGRRILNFDTSGVFRPAFHRGDSNGDGLANIADPVRILMRLFGDAAPFPCLEAADSNNDGFVDISDAVFICEYLFLGAAEVPPPGPPSLPCGGDPDRAGSWADLGCLDYPFCAWPPLEIGRDG